MHGQDGVAAQTALSRWRPLQIGATPAALNSTHPVGTGEPPGSTVERGSLRLAQPRREPAAGPAPVLPVVVPANCDYGGPLASRAAEPVWLARGQRWRRLISSPRWRS